MAMRTSICKLLVMSTLTCTSVPQSEETLTWKGIGNSSYLSFLPITTPHPSAHLLSSSLVPDWKLLSRMCSHMLCARKMIYSCDIWDLLAVLTVTMIYPPNPSFSLHQPVHQRLQTDLAEGPTSYWHVSKLVLPLSTQTRGASSKLGTLPLGPLRGRANLLLNSN
jgi:hypothetical protein